MNFTGLGLKQTGNALMQYVISGALILLVCIAAFSALGVSINTWFLKLNHQAVAQNDRVKAGEKLHQLDKAVFTPYPNEIRHLTGLNAAPLETTGGNGRQDYSQHHSSGSPMPQQGKAHQGSQNSDSVFVPECAPGSLVQGVNCPK